MNMLYLAALFVIGVDLMAHAFRDYNQHWDLDKVALILLTIGLVTDGWISYTLREAPSDW